jgi:hypothetical protein
MLSSPVQPSWRRLKSSQAGATDGLLSAIDHQTSTFCGPDAPGRAPAPAVAPVALPPAPGAQAAACQAAHPAAHAPNNRRRVAVFPTACLLAVLAGAAF